MTELDPTSLESVNVRVPEDVVLRAFEAETVMLNLVTGTYHGLNWTAGRMLEVLLESTDAGAAAAALASELDQTIERIRVDLAQLCSELAERGLIEVEHEGG